MRYLSILSIFALMLSFGCASSHEEGVKSSYRTQWTTVNADTKATTAAAEEVLKGQGLKNVESSATKIDGMAMGKMADGTKVHVTINKKGEASEVSVVVGTLGDPSLGAEMAKKIKIKAEGM